MAKIIQLCAENIVSVASGATVYFPFGAGGLLDATTVESRNQIVYRKAGICSRLAIRVTVNSRTTDSTLTFRVNGLDGNQTITVPAGEIGYFVDEINTDTISAGDLLSLEFVGGTGGASLQVSMAGGLFAANSNSVSRLIGIPAISDTISAKAGQFLAVVGGAKATTTEADRGFAVRTDGTAQNGAINVRTNTRNGNIVLRLRVNGISTDITLTIPAATAGIIEDNSSTVAISDGDIINWIIESDAGSSGSTVIDSTMLDFVTTNGRGISGALHQTNTPIAAGGTTYTVMAGEFDTLTTESIMQHQFGVKTKVKALGVNINAMSLDADTVITLRKNGIATALVLNALTTDSGHISATGNIVFQPDDLCSIQFDASASGSGSMNLRTLDLMFEVVSGGSGGGKGNKGKKGGGGGVNIFNPGGASLHQVGNAGIDISHGQ